VKRILLIFALGACLSAACGGNSSPSPTMPSTTTTVPTRIIGLSGNLASGNVTVGQSATTTLTVTNGGNSTLTVSGMTITSGLETVFTTSWASGAIPAGGSQHVSTRFAPTVAQSYGGTVTVNGDQTSGTNTIAISGTGVAQATTTFTVSGVVNDGTTGASGRIPGATVTVFSGRSAVTDSNGTYAVTGIAASTYTLSASATNFQTVTKQVSVSGNTAVDFSLARVTSSPTTRARIGATCVDGTPSSATGSGACSSHGGVLCWRYNDGTCTNP
jgi:hypothetical protein